MSPDRLAAVFEGATTRMATIADDLALLIQQQDALRKAHESAERSKRRLTWVTIAVLLVAVIAFGSVMWANQRQFSFAAADRRLVADRQTCELELIGRWAAALGRRDAARGGEDAQALREEALQRAYDMERVRELCP